jgi:hypothetical protein
MAAPVNGGAFTLPARAGWADPVGAGQAGRAAVRAATGAARRGAGAPVRVRPVHVLSANG